MKTLLGKTLVTLIFLISFAGIQQVYGQEKVKYVTVCQVFDNLVFGLRFNNDIAEINKLMIKQIQERGVDFKFNTKEEENAFRKIGASDSLIQAIRENYPKELGEKIDLYKKFTDNYAGKTIEQRKIAIDAAKKFIEKFGNLEDNKEIIEYLKKWIPTAERQIAVETQK